MMSAFPCLLLLALWQSPRQDNKVVSATDLYKTASPSVVLIEVYDDGGKVSGSGSGFVVGADGAILTNYHVVAHTKRATVRLANGDAYDDVSVLDLDKRKGIALIKIKAIDLPPLKLGHSASVQVGDKLYALGNPLGVFQNTLSEGILSGVRQGDGYRIFQLSTPISHGSSGSPVFDSHGDVVGMIDAAIEEGQNINLAIPIDYAAGLLSSRSPRALESIYEPPKPDDTSGDNSPTSTAKPKPTDALKSDAWGYLTTKISLWTKEDAEKELGAPSMRRDAVVHAGITGDIYKYTSPVAAYSNIEMHFARPQGKLIAIYFYPQGVLAWKTMKANLGHTHYEKQKAENGAVFYRYQSNQRTVSIFVDSQGSVVNVGVW